MLIQSLDTISLEPCNCVGQSPKSVDIFFFGSWPIHSSLTTVLTGTKCNNRLKETTVWNTGTEPVDRPFGWPPSTKYLHLRRRRILISSCFLKKYFIFSLSLPNIILLIMLVSAREPQGDLQPSAVDSLDHFIWCCIYGAQPSAIKVSCCYIIVGLPVVYPVRLVVAGEPKQLQQEKSGRTREKGFKKIK